MRPFRSPRPRRPLRPPQPPPGVLAAGLLGLATACAGPAAPGPAATGTAPVAAPEAAFPGPGGPAATAAGGAALGGRLLVLVPGPPGDAGTLSAVDAATGEAQALWPVAEPGEAGDTPQDWAIAPDGRRIAYLLKGGTGRALIVLRDLAPAAPRRVFPVPDGGADVLLWLPDGGLAYGWLDLSRGQGETGLARLAHWALRRLDPATGRDEAVVTLDAEQLGRPFARLAGYDPAAGRAALLLGPGENFFVDTLRLLDTRSGATVADLSTRDEGFQALASPDGRRVAYGECLGCNAAGLGTVNVLTLAAGPEELTRLALGQKVVGLRWAPDGRALAWTTYQAATSLPGENHGAGFAIETEAGWRAQPGAASSGSALAWSPDGSALLTNQALIRPGQADPPAPPPWPLPGGLSWEEAPWRVLGWVP